MCKKITSIFLVLTAFFAAFGCSESFEPFNYVNKLRILAVQAEPPSLLPGEETQVSALVYEPNGKELAYHWDWCPIRLPSSMGFGCAISEEEFRKTISDVDPDLLKFIPTFDLGNDPEITLTHFVNPALIDAICKSKLKDIIEKKLGFPVCGTDVPISVRLDVSNGQETVSALKAVHLATDTSVIPNENPYLGEILFRGKNDQDKGWQPLAIDGENQLIAGTSYDIEITIDESIAETFTPPASDTDPNPTPRKERLFLTWFVTLGETEFSRTGFIEDIQDFQDLGKNTYFVPPQAGEQVTFFFVIQDERGGVGFTVRTAKITE